MVSSTHLQSYNLLFSKYAGAGNDFILIDDRLEKFPIHIALIQRLCDRNLGIGADGLILLQPSQRAHFRMRIFNADGNEAEMCGNGVRCLVKFLTEVGVGLQKGVLETMHRLISFECLSDEVSVGMGAPTDLRWNLLVSLKNGKQLRLHHLNTGVPHAVYFMEQQEFLEFDINQLGTLIRHHSFFQPQGANANFAWMDSNREIWTRTFERGVEGETLACGTGATAVALAAAKLFRLPAPITIHTRSKENLTISFTLQEETFTNVTMAGGASRIFRGETCIH